MKLVLTALPLAASLSLAACQKKEAAPEAAAPAGPTPPAARADVMAGMDVSTAEKMAKGSGTVTAIAADSITLDHGPIAEANWPAMTMAFKASPEIVKQVKVGDEIEFDIKLKGGGGEVTAVRKPQT